MSLAVELGQLCDAARASGLSMLDIAAIERLLERHHERRICRCDRPDLLAGDQLAITP